MSMESPEAVWSEPVLLPEPPYRLVEEALVGADIVPIGDRPGAVPQEVRREVPLSLRTSTGVMIGTGFAEPLK
jgi:hypothetical protein